MLVVANKSGSRSSKAVSGVVQVGVAHWPYRNMEAVQQEWLVQVQRIPKSEYIPGMNTDFVCFSTWLSS